ncbi:MAG: TetR/AcrR family transcriptional regulator [Oscillospiraceae bacterium]
MPKIFSEEDRESIRKNLLENGRTMLERKSYKDISVAEIAEESGIAKGTFYNFFGSKEEFFYEVMLLIRDNNRNELLKTAETPSREVLYKVLYKRYTTTKTVYDYFTPEEMKIIFRRLPEKMQEADENSVELAQKLISFCTENKKVNAEVVVNLMNIAASASANREFLIEKHYRETISVLANAIADYIYGGTQNEH